MFHWCLIIVLLGRVIRSSEPQNNELTCGNAWLNFNSDLFDAKSHILATISAVSKGRNGVWSVEMGAMRGAPILHDKLKLCSKTSCLLSSHHGYCILFRWSSAQKPTAERTGSLPEPGAFPAEKAGGDSCPSPWKSEVGVGLSSWLLEAGAYFPLSPLFYWQVNICILFKLTPCYM